ncbi:hypothetical protein BC830DRAFT_70688 [Chytriomyces sp. MP71]|nr:hypothetical protein BC830DRAFT_70688 [Chytriomyces sp. MP71]
MDAIRLVSAIIDTLSIVLNTATAFANLPYLRKLPPSSFLIVFICLCDAFHTLNDVITVCAHVLIPDATKSVCKTTAILSTLGGMSSILLCTGLILFRYLVIIHEISIPFWFAPSYTAVSFFIILALVSIPVFLSATNETYGVHPTGLICTVVWYKTDAVTRSCTRTRPFACAWSKSPLK